MRRREAGSGRDLLAGTLDMLILQMLRTGRAHGLQIAQEIERRSDDLLLVEQGSLYPALYRLEERGWVASEWGVSARNRKVRIYRITASGRKQLEREVSAFERMLDGIARVMRMAQS